MLPEVVLNFLSSNFSGTTRIPLSNSGRKQRGAKKESMDNAKRVSDLLVDALNGGVQESYLTETRIELEIRTLAATIGNFMKQTDQWHAATHAINTAIKEIGDFENWMKTMDLDCKSINTAICNIYQE